MSKTPTPPAVSPAGSEDRSPTPPKRLDVSRLDDEREASAARQPKPEFVPYDGVEPVSLELAKAFMKEMGTTARNLRWRKQLSELYLKTRKVWMDPETLADVSLQRVFKQVLYAMVHGMRVLRIVNNGKSIQWNRNVDNLGNELKKREEQHYREPTRYNNRHHGGRREENYREPSRYNNRHRREENYREPQRYNNRRHGGRREENYREPQRYRGGGRREERREPNFRRYRSDYDRPRRQYQRRPDSEKPCFEYEKTGRCRFGVRCRYNCPAKREVAGYKKTYSSHDTRDDDDSPYTPGPSGMTPKTPRDDDGYNSDGSVAFEY